MIFKKQDNTVKDNILENGFSINSIELRISSFLSEISTKFNNTDIWQKNYVSARFGKSKASAAIVLRATNGQLDLAVKYIANKGNDRAQGVTGEYEHLQQVFNSLSARHKDVVPRPLHADRDAYAVEWVDLPVMKSQLVWGRFISPHRLSCLEAAARALKLIHQATAQCDRPLDLPRYIADARRSGATAASWKQSLERLVKISKKFEGVPVPHCRLHGDYSPENLLFSNKKIVVIDFSVDLNGPVYHDMCHCIMYFSFYCNNIFDNTFKLLRSDMEAFRCAYSGTDTPAHSDAFMLMQWAVMLTRWGRHEAKSRDPERASKLRALDWYFARQLEACCLGLQEALSRDSTQGM